MRAVCAALGLDAGLEEEVRELRGSLLRLTHTREFAPEAEFKVRRLGSSVQSLGMQRCRCTSCNQACSLHMHGLW